MKKTKIICSMGPVSDNYETLKEMILNGMNVARINFSHADYEGAKKVLYLIDVLNKELNTNVGILFDTKGPDFRTGVLENDKVDLEKDHLIRLEKGNFLGNANVISVNYDKALDYIDIGKYILLEDGLMKLEVVDKDINGITCKVINGGVLGSRKSINVPGVKLNIPFLSENDINDIKFSCERDGDFLALSFVSCKEDILAVKEIIKDTNIQIISKIENDEAIDNIDEIIDVSDGIMVARGDLGVELPMQRIPTLQKEIIEKCREKGKTCIVATEMLASMYTNSRPTRAEVNDIYNAVLDGADSVMLSGETTIGKYPIDAVKYMNDICREAESKIDYKLDRREKHGDIPATIAHSVVEAAEILNCKMIVATTLSGYTAKKIANLKPVCPVLATCPSSKVARSLSLSWGISTTLTDIYSSTDEIVNDAIEKAKKFKRLKEGDIIIITGGKPNSKEKKSTNIMKVEVI